MNQQEEELKNTSSMLFIRSLVPKNSTIIINKYWPMVWVLLLVVHFMVKKVAADVIQGIKIK